MNATRVKKFKARVMSTLAAGPADVYRGIVEELHQETGAPVEELAAALASLAQGKVPLLLGARDESRAVSPQEVPERRTAPRAAGRFGAQDTYRLEVGSEHGVEPGHIVGAIANEAGLDGQEINGVKVRADHTLVRLPAGMPQDVLQRLTRVKVRGRPLAIQLLGPRPKKHRKGHGR